MSVSVSACAQAVENGEVETVESYIESGGDVNARNLFQSQLLHIASREGHLAIARLLLDAGAELNSLDYGGMRRTALHWACQQGHLEVVELLVERGADTKVWWRTGAVWCSLDLIEQAQGRSWSKLVQGQRCGKMIDTEAPYGELPANLCRNDALKLALERPPWDPIVHHRFPARFRATIKAFVLSTARQHREPPAGDAAAAASDESTGEQHSNLGANKDGTCEVHHAESNMAGADEPAESNSLRGWCLPNEIVHRIIASIAYPISCWVLDGDWAPPVALLR